MNTYATIPRHRHRFSTLAVSVTLAVFGGLLAMAQSGAATVRLTVNTDSPSHNVHPYVYGHFFEHIYHSANGGLWGELVWNRSFELSNSGMGDWSSENGEIIQSALITDVRFTFGENTWRDYELTLQALKEGGAEGFLVLFRAKADDSFYWLNLGGWGNTRHAVEKESAGGRGTIGQGRTGRIETGRWYDVRVRCEGNHLQCWLDGEPIIDLRDSDNPHLMGMIGLGTWGTHARYRNIQVKSLDGGGELFSGLPELPTNEFKVDFWTHHGSGDVEKVRDALNNEYSVNLTSHSSPTGLEQANFRFIPQAYVGSVWMKGSLPAGVKLELLNGEEPLGEVVLGPPTAGWAEYPFQIQSSGSTLEGSLRITLLGEGFVKLDQVSLMGQDAVATGGFRPDLLDAVRGLRPPIIRWPGGCFASVYLWKDAIGPQHQRRIYPAYMWEDQDINSFGTDEYMRLCETLGVEPLLVINTGILEAGCGAPAQFRLASEADYLPYALQWMEYCNGDTSTPMGALRAANGHPEPYNVVYWELDNETWAAGVDAYIARVREFAPAMRAKAAELGTPIKIIACGGNRDDMRWNTALIDACAPLMDYISIHNYENPQNFDSGVRRYENLLVQLAEYIATSPNPGMEIYNSEWNAQSTDWRTGLYAGGLLNAYERQGGKFTLGGPALFLRHQSAGAWDNAFINFDHTGWFPAPNYVVMKLWWDNFAPKFLPVAGDPQGCNIIASRGESGDFVVVKAVNPRDRETPVEVDLNGGFAPKTASMQLVAPGSLRARNTLDAPTAVRVQAGAVQLNGQHVRFTLPAYSTAVIRLNATGTAPERPFPTPLEWKSTGALVKPVSDATHSTGDDGRFYRSRTRIEEFPKGMSNPEIAIQDNRNNLFEASVTYKIKGSESYLTLIEALSPARYYRAWISDRLDGEWTPVRNVDTWENPFAGINNVVFEDGVTPWTRDISHGELLRDGYDETMTIDPKNLQFLYQGRDPASGGRYELLPYRLGLLKLDRSGRK